MGVARAAKSSWHCCGAGLLGGRVGLSFTMVSDLDRYQWHILNFAPA
jgi:hypothetical protein